VTGRLTHDHLSTPGATTPREAAGPAWPDRDFAQESHRGSGDGLAPILLVAAEETSPERLEHEYALKSELDADWAARPVALTHYDA
jgi:hypothetical protein